MDMRLKASEDHVEDTILPFTTALAKQEGYESSIFSSYFVSAQSAYLSLYLCIGFSVLQAVSNSESALLTCVEVL